jgi:DNA (cytosine-5)-methyltransferase 1
LQASRFAHVLKPKLIFFENVPGLASPDNSRLIDKLRASLPADYTLSRPERVDAADYNVPQRRVRCIMLAARGSSIPVLPKPSSPEGYRVTVRDTIFGLLTLNSGESDPDDPLHFARSHQSVALRRLASIPKDGGSRSALPRRLQLTCHLGHRGHPDVYGRMKWDDLAPTLTTGCTDVTKGRYAHPEDDRAITLREAALLQTFPTKYRFKGGSGEIATQVGNAVPVRLMDALLPTFRRVIRDQMA